jgi:cytochrome c oxidase subunit 3
MQNLEYNDVLYVNKWKEFMVLSRKWLDFKEYYLNNYKDIAFNFYLLENFLILFLEKNIKFDFKEINYDFLSNIIIYKIGKKLIFWNQFSVYNIIAWRYKNTSSNIQFHNYHLVNASSLPFLASIGAFTFLFGFVLYMHNYKLGDFTLKYGLYFLILISIYWWRDVIIEGAYKGYHTIVVKQGLRLGMILFIVSEVMFFFSFFWAFFHSSLNPSVVLGSVWPPIGINPIDPIRIPLLNTTILLLSGVFLTWSHSVIKKKWLFNEYREKLLLDYYYYLPLKTYWLDNDNSFDTILNISRNEFIPYLTSYKEDNSNFFYNLINFHLGYLKQIYFNFNLFSWIKDWDKQVSLYFLNIYFMYEAVISLLITIILGLEFTWWQYYEYYNATFYIFDGVYGSTFYMTTGLHGLHVLIGTIFLIVCFFRLINLEFNWKSHIGYECAIWYWHFVDVVWIIVFSVIYCWGAGYDHFYK